ncbi:MAG: lysine transporter LysE [Amycolatopsis sp.]|uniref:LysE family translocator n=1 Tax=Amycolatopsis sp. TaxID=37632 RepID=UPI002612C629|nr:LysE family translocator [Amycolatopsis sp.]MCU1682542.1 lysine transporter LysE [Amycolatopsis sp.]
MRAVITWPFLVTCVVMVLTPGPSLAVMINQSLRSGRAAGLATVAGNTSGLVFWATASAFGLTALIRTSEVAFVVLKVAGALYLLWLGVQALRRSRVKTDKPVVDAAVTKGLAASYRAGLVANLTNPKAAVLYLALMPQFLVPGDNTLLNTAVLVGVQMSISAAWYAVVVLAVGLVRQALARPVVRRRMDRISGLVLVGLGIRMATLTSVAVT